MHHDTTIPALNESINFASHLRSSPQRGFVSVIRHEMREGADKEELDEDVDLEERGMMYKDDDDMGGEDKMVNVADFLDALEVALEKFLGEPVEIEDEEEGEEMDMDMEMDMEEPEGEEMDMDMEMDMEEPEEDLAETIYREVLKRITK